MIHKGNDDLEDIQQVTYLLSDPPYSIYRVEIR